MNEREITWTANCYMLLRLMRKKPELKERIINHLRWLEETFIF
jgi:hypothetical protein